MKKNFYISFVIFILFIFTGNLIADQTKSSLNNSNIIILKNGNEFKGYLKKIENDNVTFVINGKERIFKKSDIARIQFHQKRMFEEVNSIKQISDKEIQESWIVSKKWQPSDDIQAVILLDKILIEFKHNNRINIKIKKAIKILNEEGKEQSTQYFYYPDNNSNVRLLYGITISPYGKITSLEESAINDEPVNNKFSQYNLLHRIKFGLKDVDIGSIIVWEAEIDRSYDDLTQPYLLEKDLLSYNNIEKRIIKVISPKNLKINYSLYEGLIGIDKPSIKREFINNQIIITCEQNIVPGFINDEDNSPSDSMIYPKFYITPDNTWKNLCNRYYEKYFKKSVSNNIKNFALNIIKDEKNNLNILKLLYDYVNRQISLIDIPMEQYYFTPIEEDKLITYSNLNILDKSYLFTRMAQSLNIPVKMYFYRKNFNNKLMNQCPSLRQFDSVICEAIIDDKKTYYSFEDENFNAGQFYDSISEAEAFDVTKKDSTTELLNNIPYDYNHLVYNYKCNLNEDNSILINKITTIYGAAEAIWRGKRFLSKEELDKYMKSQINNFGNDVVLKNYRFINSLSDFDKPIILEEEILVNNFSFTSGINMKIFKIPDLHFDSGSVNKIKRILPYSTKAHESDYQFEFIFPKKYKAGNIPKSLNIEHEDFSFYSKYNTIDNKIIVELKIIYKKDLISVSFYNDLKNFIESQARLINEWILLEGRL